MPAAFDSVHWAMTADGNSLMDPGQGGAAGSKVMLQLAALPPINGQIVVSNFAIAGQTVLGMTASRTDVNFSYQPGKTNVLLVWETTNNLFNAGRTVAETIADTKQYIQACQGDVAGMLPAQKPWVVVIVGTIPRAGIGTAGNQQLLDCDDYFKNNLADMGAAMFIDLRRAGGPFAFSDVDNFDAFDQNIYNNDHIHLKDAGTAVVAGYMAESLATMPDYAAGDTPVIPASASTTALLTVNGRPLFNGALLTVSV